LEEAHEKDNPLIERVKFWLLPSRLDEFVEVRVSSFLRGSNMDTDE
jgi:polyphosphate kinase